MSKAATKSVPDQFDEAGEYLHFEDYALVSVLVIVGVAELVVRSVSMVGLIPLLIAAEQKQNLLTPYCFGAAERVLKGAYRKQQRLR